MCRNHVPAQLNVLPSYNEQCIDTSLTHMKIIVSYLIWTIYTMTSSSCIFIGPEITHAHHLHKSPVIFHRTPPFYVRSLPCTSYTTWDSCIAYWIEHALNAVHFWRVEATKHSDWVEWSGVAWILILQYLVWWMLPW